MKIEIPKDIKQINTGERYFEIRDIGSDSCGSFSTFCVNKETKNEDIFNIACEEWTNEMLRKEELYFPSIFRNPPKWRNTIKVYEMERKTLPPGEWEIKKGKDYKNVWNTKRKGLKFQIHNSWCEIVMTNGNKYRGNGYRFDKILS